MTTARHRVTERGAVSPTCPAPEVAETQGSQVQNALSPRRKRRSAEVRNSLRLFGLLAVLAGVNVYVFFFNHGTAPRDVQIPLPLEGATLTLNITRGDAGPVVTSTATYNSAQAAQTLTFSPTYDLTAVSLTLER